MASFVRDAVHAVMAETDPIFGQLQRTQMPEGVSSIRVDVGDVSTPSPGVELAEEVELARDDIVQGNLERLYEVVFKVADAFLAQFMKPFFEYVGDAAEAVGNSVSLEGRPLTWDDMLDTFEKVEWSADDTGRVRPPQVAAGTTARAAMDALPDLTPDQQRRWASIIVRKQEAHVSRRRSRRLRSESD